jgi:hypothetical protein
LVGNHGDGLIYAYNPAGPANQTPTVLRISSGDTVGTRTSPERQGAVLTWSLAGINLNQCDWGNGVADVAAPNSLFCVRGVGELETHGLFFRYTPYNC